MKTALICGVSGQDGGYLSRLLLQKGYKVIGTSRDAQVASFSKLDALGIKHLLTYESMCLTDFRSVLQVILKVEPDEIYNLAGQTSVGLSFQQPVETLESISLGTLNLLEAIRFSGENIKFYNAGSSECFGNTGSVPADELTPFKPQSPYAVAKAAAFWEVANYRDAYGLHACSGILFNHESPLRATRFVTQKIIESVRSISRGEKKELTLGNMSIIRDWGWAPEYVDAMWRMLQTNAPEDYVIATGTSNSLQEYINLTFAYYQLDPAKYVRVDDSLFRPSDLMESRANPEKAFNLLGWEAQYGMRDIVRMMIEGLTN